jgi:hypothetical protein
MKRVMMIALVLLAAAVAVPAATATPPIKVPVLAPEDFQLDGVCSFSIGFHVLVNRETQTTFSDGTILITGSFTDQITNLSDPTKSLIDNNSGPITETPNADGSVISVKVTGQGALFFFPGQLGPGSPGQLLLTNGLFQEQVDANGIVPGSVSYRGKTPTDVCIALA